MKTKTFSLESYLKKNMSVPTGAKSYQEYVRTNGGGFKDSYLAGVSKALTNRKKSLSGYGSVAESLASDGLNGGYAERINDIAEEKLSERLDALTLERQQRESQLLTGYSKYLDGIKKKRESLKNSVAKKLIEGGVLNPDAAYSYGIGMGLTESEADEVKKGVYDTLRLKVMSDILKEVAALNLDPDRAVMVATDKGLNSQDVEIVKKRAKEYYSVSGFDSSYLDYLESIGNKTTSTFN